MNEHNSESEEAATLEYWNEKARRNADKPGHAVGVDDPLRNRCIENAQRVIVSREISAAADALPESAGSVLDFGCGVGRWVDVLRDHFVSYHGVDISDEMINIARRDYPDGRFSVLKNLKVDAEDNSVDFVLCVAVLHHNAYVNQDILIGELSRVLRPQGQLLLMESKGRRVDGQHEVFYPRLESDWIGACEHHGLSHLHTSGTSYQFAAQVLNRLLPSRLAKSRPVVRVAGEIDALVTPYLAPHLPQRFHDRLLMRFEN